jgi:plastocyanin
MNAILLAILGAALLQPAPPARRADDPPRAAGPAANNRPAARVEVVSDPPAPPVEIRLHRKAPDRASRRRPTSYKVTDVVSGGTIEGVVRYIGKAPPPRRIQVVKDHATCDQRPKEEHLIRYGAAATVAEAVVYLANLREGKGFAPRDKAPLIDQRTCTFRPHVQAVRVNEPVEILNSDPVAHNINASQRIYTLFNILQPQQNMRATQTFDKPGLVNLKCNVHDWMQAYVHVFAHPYHEVTGNDGKFRFENVPPGRHDIAVWQEYLGEQLFDVELQPGQTIRVIIELQPRPGEEGTRGR